MMERMFCHDYWYVFLDSSFRMLLSRARKISTAKAIGFALKGCAQPQLLHQHPGTLLTAQVRIGLCLRIHPGREVSLLIYSGFFNSVLHRQLNGESRLRFYYELGS